MESMEFNGWSNRETWAMNLWIENEYALNETACEYARTEVEGHDKAEAINPYFLGESLKNYFEEDLFTFENVSKNKDLFNMLTDIGSLYRINWFEIAESYISDALTEQKARA